MDYQMADINLILLLPETGKTFSRITMSASSRVDGFCCRQGKEMFQVLCWVERYDIEVSFGRQASREICLSRSQEYNLY